MARILLGVPPAVGHIHPTIPIALRLRACGHEVEYVCHPAFEELLQRHGLAMAKGFRWGDRILRAQTLHGRGIPMAAATLAATRGRGIRHLFFEDLSVAAAALADHMRRRQTDALVSDYLFSPGPIAADMLGLPYATSFPSVPFPTGDPMPPYGSGLSPKAKRGWRWRFHDMANRFTQHRFTGLINRARRGHGLRPISRTFFRLSPYLILAYMTEALEYSCANPLPQTHYIGPCALPAEAGKDDDFPWDRLDGRPVVFATLGSIYTGRTAFFDDVIEASRGADWLLVVTVGRRQDVRRWAGAPENVIVRNWAPTPPLRQMALLPHVRAVVSHGGMNTVMETLAAGIPIAILPANVDQPEAAQRVVEAGAGLRLDLRKATAPILRAAIRRLLDDPALQEGARQVAADFARCDGPGTAARLIERLAETRAPILRPAGCRATVYASPDVAHVADRANHAPAR